MKLQKNLRQYYVLPTCLVIALNYYTLAFAVPLNTEHSVTGSNSQQIQFEDVVMVSGDGGELKTVRRP